MDLGNVWLVLSTVLLCARCEITVIRMVLRADQEVTVHVNRSVEYMMDFTPSYSSSFNPSHVRLRTDGGDPAHPVLFTARQRLGALTWQVPYVYHGRVFYERERTLCLESYGEDAGAANCTMSETFVPNAFSLHVSSTCASSVPVRVTGGTAADWALSMKTPRTSVATERRPALQYYVFTPGQDMVRVVLESPDDVCATVLVQNYSTCPIAHTEQDLFMATIRMTMQRSAGMHIGRDRFPVGFYVTTIVQASDAECSGEPSEGWSWSEVWAGQREGAARNKTITTRVQAALTPSQYALASAATILVFLLFYVAALAAVLAQRWPLVRRCTAPKAVLADASSQEAMAEPQRVRRLSHATFDSRYDSDSDEDPAPTPTPASASALNLAPATASGPTAAPAVADDTAVSSDDVPADDPASAPVTAPGNDSATAEQTTNAQSPYGLPAVLTLAATARRRARTLAARSDRYLHIMYTVALFYALPVVQFVTAFQIVMNVSGSLDICYYNFLCAHGLGGLADFNHVLSNAGYLLLGALLLLQLRRRRRRRRRAPRHEGYGIPPHDGLLYLTVGPQGYGIPPHDGLLYLTVGPQGYGIPPHDGLLYLTVGPQGYGIPPHDGLLYLTVGPQGYGIPPHDGLLYLTVGPQGYGIPPHDGLLYLTVGPQGYGIPPHDGLLYLTLGPQGYGIPPHDGLLYLTVGPQGYGIPPHDGLLYLTVGPQGYGIPPHDGLLYLTVGPQGYGIPPHDGLLYLTVGPQGYGIPPHDGLLYLTLGPQGYGIPPHDGLLYLTVGPQGYGIPPHDGLLYLTVGPQGYGIPPHDGLLYLTLGPQGYGIPPHDGLLYLTVGPQGYGIPPHDGLLYLTVGPQGYGIPPHDGLLYLTVGPQGYGIPPHDGLLSALGCGMMVVGVLSASYHVCPNRLNFQFDMAFMYVLAAVSMVKIYQSRHPDVNARAHVSFAVLAILMIFVLWGVLGGSSFFWAVWTVLHLVTVFLLSLRIYYLGQFRLEKGALAVAARGLARLPRCGLRPLYRARLLLLAVANAVNWALALYGLWKQSTDFASHLLELLLMNTLLYMVFYMSMKLVHGERPRWYAWLFLAGAAAAWAPALYYFVSGSSDWSATPAQSRHLNHECKVLQFYDSHDLWHMLSAAALYLSFNAMMTWDDGLAAVRREDIAVF